MPRRPLPIRIIRRLERHPVAVTSVLSLGYKIGKDATKVKKGAMDAWEFRRRTGSHLGGTGLSAAGVALGAKWGTVVAPGIGTLLGGFAGSIVGEALGSRAGREAVSRVATLLGYEVPSDHRGEAEAPSEEAAPAEEARGPAADAGSEADEEEPAREQPPGGAAPPKRSL